MHTPDDAVVARSSRRDFVRLAAASLGGGVLVGSQMLGCGDRTSCPPPSPTPTPTPDVSAEVDREVEEFRRRTDAPGVALAIVRPEAGSSRPTYDIRTFGSARRDADDDPITPTTIFEIGSITKTFTACALAWLWRHLGVVELDGLVQQHLPDRVTLPVWRKAGQGGSPEIRFRDLATFTPGFPDDSFGTFDELFAWINREGDELLQFEPGSCYLYSDAGWELLGYSLSYAHSRGANLDYARLLADVLAAANLAMSDTVINLTPDQRQRFACGYNDRERNCARIKEGQLLIKSTIADMALWLAFQMGLMPDSPLADVLAVMHEVHYEGGSFEMGSCDHRRTIRTGLGWFVNELPGVGTQLSKNGGTVGFSSYITFVRESSTGIMLLVNHNQTNVAHLGDRLLCLINPGCTA